MAVCWLLCVLRGGRLVVDWHNYGFTILALTHPETHPLVRLAKWYAPSLCCSNNTVVDLIGSLRCHVNGVAGSDVSCAPQV